MDTALLYKISMGIGAIVSMVALSYTYDLTKHPKSKWIVNLFWILGNVFLVICLFLRLQTSYDITAPVVLILVVNFAIWKKNLKIREIGDQDK